jgi:hypothetical protein
MRTITDKLLKNGKRRVVVELDPGVKLVPVRPDAHYRLGYPVEDVVASHVVEVLQRVAWCSASQEWVDA